MAIETNAQPIPRTIQLGDWLMTTAAAVPMGEPPLVGRADYIAAEEEEEIDRQVAVVEDAELGPDELYMRHEDAERGDAPKPIQRYVTPPHAGQP